MTALSQERTFDRGSPYGHFRVESGLSGFSADWTAVLEALSSKYTAHRLLFTEPIPRAPFLSAYTEFSTASECGWILKYPE